MEISKDNIRYWIELFNECFESRSDRDMNWALWYNASKYRQNDIYVIKHFDKLVDFKIDDKYGISNACGFFLENPAAIHLIENIKDKIYENRACEKIGYDYKSSCALNLDK